MCVCMRFKVVASFGPQQSNFLQAAHYWNLSLVDIDLYIYIYVYMHMFIPPPLTKQHKSLTCVYIYKRPSQAHAVCLSKYGAKR